MGRLRTWTVLGLCVALGSVVPAQVAGRDARGFYEDDAASQLALSAGVQRWVRGAVNRQHFQTGSAFFDAEWVFGSYMMAAMGLGQVALAHPEVRARHADAVAGCLDQLLSDRVRSFDRVAWGSDALGSLDTEEGHAAYLGYLNLALGMHRRLDPHSRFATHHDRISAALARRFEQSHSGLIATYPGETYPVDNLAAIASLALHSRLTGEDRGQLISRLIARMRSDYVDPKTGLLIQAVTEAGLPADDGRGSGTALGAYFASYANLPFARELHVALRSQLAASVVGFGVVREYTHDRGRGDIDSGPLVLGLSVSATGFSLGSARAAGDFEHFERVYRTAHLFGAPHRSDDEATFVGGGPLGNAIMLAMLTAPRAEVER